MEQYRRFAIFRLKRTGHNAKDIVQLLIGPKTTVQHDFKRCKDHSVADSKDHKTPSDSKRNPRVLAALKHFTEANLE